MKNTLKLNKDFKRLYYRGKCVACHNVVIYAQKSRLDMCRVGLTCGKSVGGAVQRNRAKRLMRECYRTLSPRIQGNFDIVIVAKSKISDKKCDEVLRDVKYAFKKLSIII